ncbi:MAG: hypothetical protein ACPG4N_05760 [Gammaproteobacteria bacterium]
MSAGKKAKKAGAAKAGSAPGIPTPKPSSAVVAAAAAAAAAGTGAGLSSMPGAPPPPPPTASASSASSGGKKRKHGVGRFGPEARISGAGAEAMEKAKAIGLTPGLSVDQRRAKLKPLLPALHSAARGKREHEFVNTAEGDGYVAETMAGATQLQPSVTATDGQPYTLEDLQADQRMNTYDYHMKPKKGTDMGSEFADQSSSQYYAHGHVGAAKARKPGGGFADVVESQGASVGDMHSAQLAALKKSRHIRSLSARLDKVTDRFQADSDDILAAADDGGFHPDSRRMRPPKRKRAAMKPVAMDTPESALAFAEDAHIAKRKRQTLGKRIREHLPSAASDSEAYSEIDTDSEVDSDHEAAARQRFKKRARVEEFRANHGLPGPAGGSAPGTGPGAPSAAGAGGSGFPFAPPGASASSPFSSAPAPFSGAPSPKPKGGGKGKG